MSYPEMKERLQEIERRLEHQRLKDAAVNAARAARAAETRRDGEGDESFARLIAAEKAAVFDLLEFESQTFHW